MKPTRTNVQNMATPVAAWASYKIFLHVSWTAAMISPGKDWHSTVLHNRAQSTHPRDAPTPDKKESFVVRNIIQGQFL
jgi:hypothetical protein